MQNIDWNDIRHFLEVIRSGSVSKAAIRLDVNHTTVSRRIKSLENQLGHALFDRSNNDWKVTPAGELITAYAESMSENVSTIERQVLADSHELRGTLRVTTASHCLEQLAMPAIHKFIKQFPEIDLEVIVSADELNLASREADVALRGTDQPPPNLLGKRITQIGMAVYGIQVLKEQVEKDPSADNIPCITWTGDGNTRPSWIEKDFPASKRIYRTTSWSGMLAMVREGIGIAQIACILGDTDSRLHRIQTKYVEPGPGLWVLSHVDLRTTARVRIFRDFLVEELEKQKDLIKGEALGINGIPQPGHR